MIQPAIPFLLGLVLGLALIIPIGVQSLFVLNQGLLVGFPRAFLGVVAVCSCDTLLIVLGAMVASTLLAVLGFQELLIGVGSTYLLIMWVLTLRVRAHRAETEHLTHLGTTVVQAVGVSVLNPHAILDTVGVLGAAISAQATEGRVAFVAGGGGRVVGVVLADRCGRLGFGEADHTPGQEVDPAHLGSNNAHPGRRLSGGAGLKGATKNVRRSRVAPPSE